LVLKRHVAYIVFFFVSQSYIFLMAWEIVFVGAKESKDSGGLFAKLTKVVLVV